MADHVGHGQREFAAVRPATTIAAVLLSIVAVLQLLRAIAGVRVVIGNTEVPVWASVVAFFVVGGIAVMLWRESRR